MRNSLDRTLIVILYSSIFGHLYIQCKKRKARVQNYVSVTTVVQITQVAPVNQAQNKKPYIIIIRLTHSVIIAKIMDVLVTLVSYYI